MDFNFNSRTMVNWRATLSLAFQSLGIVYGDIGTSPLYVFASTFTQGIHHKDDVIGVLSLILYTMTLMALGKYVFLILRANDNGEGGTFALYSLICRNAKMGFIPNEEAEDGEVPMRQRTQKIKEKLESSKVAHIILFLLTIMGTSMVIGDGILTPSISVLSAVSGIKEFGETAVVWGSVAILMALFTFQRYGTDKVGLCFAPIILIWFTYLMAIGVYNLFKYDVRVLRAINPLSIVYYFQRNGKEGWMSLGGVILCITGTEAMFADLGHFSVRAIQISFSVVAYPSLVAAYCGQAAYLTKNTADVSNTFYASIPAGLYLPTLALAVAASIIASQAMISGTFSIIAQSLRLGCFPRVKVIHTSTKHEGQVYIPEINYLLMLSCVVVTLAFRTTEKIGNAYGIAVVIVMVITTLLVSLIMLIIWETSIWWIVVFLVFFGSIEMLYLSSLMHKFTSGGYLPLAITVVLMAMMGIWHYVHLLKYRYELNESISGETAVEMVSSPDVIRIPGIGLFYTDHVHGISPIFSHYIKSVSSLHSVFVLVSVKWLHLTRVDASERFSFRYVEPRESGLFSCVVRYGYKDAMEEPDEFEHEFVQYLKEFIRKENFISGEEEEETNLVPLPTSAQSSDGTRSSNEITSITSERTVPVEAIEDPAEFVEQARAKGIVHLVGETDIRACQDSSMFKKVIVDYAYQFLNKISREGLTIRRSKLLEVRMIYDL